MIKISPKAKRILLAIAVIITLLIYFSKDIFWIAYRWAVTPRKARTEIPVNYRVGWWPAQFCLSVDSFQVEIVESNLGFMNSESLFAYTVYGRLINPPRSFAELTIKEVHLSDRINRDTAQHYDRIIEITPIVQMDVNEGAAIAEKQFSFRNELNITSMFWGGNSIKFICGQHDQTVEFRQPK